MAHSAINATSTSFACIKCQRVNTFASKKAKKSNKVIKQVNKANFKEKINHHEVRVRERDTNAGDISPDF